MSFLNRNSGSGSDTGTRRLTNLPFYVNGGYGKTLAQPTRAGTGNYTGVLSATDGTGAVAEVCAWDFLVLVADVDEPANGPNGRGCTNGRVNDTVPHDNDFVCDCSGTAYTGANCDAAAEDSTGGGDQSSETTVIVSAVFVAILLGLVVAVGVVQLRARAAKNAPFDFDTEFQRLMDAGLLVAAQAPHGRQCLRLPPAARCYVPLSQSKNPC